MCAILIRRPISDDESARRPVLDFSDFTDTSDDEEPPLPDWITNPPEEEPLLWYELPDEDLYDFDDPEFDDPPPPELQKKKKKKKKKR
jgi:hypothetical protein